MMIYNSLQDYSMGTKSNARVLWYGARIFVLLLFNYLNRALSFGEIYSTLLDSSICCDRFDAYCIPFNKCIPPTTVKSLI